MSRTVSLLLIFCICWLWQCKPTIESSDFGPIGSFTSGIEGPAVDATGNLYAVNYKEEGTIGKIAPDGSAQLYIRLPDGSIANGIRFDQEGKMYIADYTKHIIWVKPSADSPIEVYASHQSMHQPNDLTIVSNGDIYCSDPDWKNNSGQLWLVRQGNCMVLETNMGTTNGVEGSPDGQYLYVNESVQRHIWRYKILPNGRLTDKTLWHHFEDYGLDGMRCDANGNLYVSRYGKGTVVVLRPNGEFLKEYTLAGKKPTNISFDPTKSRCIYITMADRGGVEKIAL
ncbi:MAG: SMP-30/gluconolactonase/LRE family protein [Flavobacteriaceae bacterium]|nr:SMP-30/gluconolactonase/LRE family protein [Flavobacteriaceae bacterium]